jgi:hypothetical protein
MKKLIIPLICLSVATLLGCSTEKVEQSISDPLIVERYFNEEKGISIDLPAGYTVYDDYVAFGELVPAPEAPGGVLMHAYSLAFEAAVPLGMVMESSRLEVTEGGQLISKIEAGFDLVEYVSSGLCDEPNLIVIGESYNYRFSATCSESVEDDMAYLENFLSVMSIVEPEVSEISNLLDEIETQDSSVKFLRSDSVFEWHADYGQTITDVLAKKITADKLTLEQWQGLHDFFLKREFEEDLSNIVDGTTEAGTGYKNGHLVCKLLGSFPAIEDQDDSELEISVDLSCGFLDTKVSETQKDFLDLRGNPGIFTILFSEVKLNDKGNPIKRETPLRSEIWTFGNPNNVTTSFENGFFVQEEKIDGQIEFLSHEVSPLYFTFNSSIDDVEALLGEADCVEKVEAGSNTLRTLKYEEKIDRPLVSISFSDDQLIAVSVGLAFTENDNEKLCE